MIKDCCESGGRVMILACSGVSNTGQMTNRTALELTRERFGRMFCLAGVGGHLEGFVKAVKSAPSLLVLDGCDKQCTRAILDHLNIPATNHLILTELGFKKRMDGDISNDEIDRLKTIIREKISAATDVAVNSKTISK